MSKLSDTARVTVADGAVWRTCTDCGRLAALAPDVARCADCDTAETPSTPTRPERSAQVRGGES